MKPTKSPLTPAGRTIVDLRRKVAVMGVVIDDLLTFFPRKHPARLAAEKMIRKII